MYILCTDSGNGYGYIRPEKGVVYSATKIELANKNVVNVTVTHIINYLL